MIGWNENGKLMKNGQESKAPYIALEYVEGGDFVDHLTTMGFFPERVCRYFSKQLLQVLHYIHSNGIAHRDIKCENILLDSNGNIRLADFGLFAPINGRDGSGILSSLVGTESFWAPEMFTQKNYSG